MDIKKYKMFLVQVMKGRIGMLVVKLWTRK